MTQVELRAHSTKIVRIEHGDRRSGQNTPTVSFDSGLSDILLPMSVNKAILVGRLGRDPETRFTSGGQAVANFTLATDETFKDRAGERQKRTEWHRIVLWGKLAEITQQYLKKGMLVYVEGRIQTRQWEDKRDGQKRINHRDRRERDAHADFARGRRCCGSRRGRRCGRWRHGRSHDADFEVAALPGRTSGAGPEISDEDIPFLKLEACG